MTATFDRRIEIQYSEETRQEISTAFLAATAIVRCATMSNQRANIVVLDIDETTLDNEVYNRWLLAERQDFPTGWKEFCLQSKAHAMPGVNAFLDDAISRHIMPVFITARDHKLTECTVRNVAEKTFIKEPNVLCLGDMKYESLEWLSVAYHIIVYIDDQIAPPHIGSCIPRVIVPNYVYGAHQEVLNASIDSRGL